MTTLFSPIREFFKKGDVLLLFLCLTASGYGLALIYSATRYLDNNNRNVIVQAVAHLHRRGHLHRPHLCGLPAVRGEVLEVAGGL